MLFSVGLTLTALLSLATQIAGIKPMKVVWGYERPDDLDANATVVSVGITSGHGLCAIIDYGEDTSCYKDYLFIAFKMLGEDVMVMNSIFVVVFEVVEGEQEDTYNYFEIKLGNDEHRKLSSQTFPTLDAVHKTFCMQESMLEKLANMAKESVMDVRENPKLYSGCVALSIAITLAIDSWLNTNAPLQITDGST